MSKILVLDDHATNRELLVSLLGYRGYRMLQAEDGLRALDVVRSERPDLVIADVLMPVMDGYEFVRRLRREREIADTTVIFYTANYLEREARMLATGCGVSLVLTKPAEPQTILDTVDRALGGALPAVTPRLDDDLSRQHTRLLTDKLAEKIEALEAASLRLSALVHLGQQLSAETDIQRLVANFCRETHEIVGSRCAAVGIFGEAGISLRQFAVAGSDVEADLCVTAPRQGILGAMLAEARPLRTRQLDAVQAAVLPAPHRRAGSFLGTAIRTATQQFGWLYFIDKLGSDEFTDEDERVASLLASQLALAYENASRYARIQQHASELERRVAERTEALTRSNADLAQFAYVASHDLQEPLRMVASYTTLLAKRYRGRLDATADEFIAFACDGAQRMQELICDLLAYSRIESQSAASGPVPLDAVLDRAMANLRRPAQDAVIEISREPLPIVNVVESQFVQLFQNLIGNAIKFHGEPPLRIRVAAERRDDEWVVSVADNGIGIAPEFSDRIFVIFQRLHSRAEYPGTGMGLAICKRVVERHGGRIWVRSAEGEGATFFFTIPDAAATAPAMRLS